MKTLSLSCPILGEAKCGVPSWYSPVSLVGVPLFLQNLTPQAEAFSCSPGRPASFLTRCPRFFPVSEPPGLHVDGFLLWLWTHGHLPPDARAPPVIPRPPPTEASTRLSGSQTSSPRLCCRTCLQESGCGRKCSLPRPLRGSRRLPNNVRRSGVGRLGCVPPRCSPHSRAAACSLLLPTQDCGDTAVSAGPYRRDRRAVSEMSVCGNGAGHTCVLSSPLTPSSWNTAVDTVPERSNAEAGRAGLTTAGAPRASSRHGPQPPPMPSLHLATPQVMPPTHLVTLVSKHQTIYQVL